MEDSTITIAMHRIQVSEFSPFYHNCALCMCSAAEEQTVANKSVDQLL